MEVLRFYTVIPEVCSDQPPFVQDQGKELKIREGTVFSKMINFVH